ncbi:MAG: alanyl-tRNA editing protein [Ardenticatenaceae bacterium]|nr:hypothetical protein [Anaerolineales bacterium]MCB8922056.1 alanyl-tRNA editing protein [Ardenticatenaceae bacterium]MCB8989632.1 alanyl-tRNA editing protein [Ardenticatenaceae bacterium]MCB9003173.1 alanyl-tRNA editing protein [Ardenticatenaceae bacterium]
MRSYYQDAYTTEFTATIVEQVIENGRTAIILDKTYFYPTSGGQPHDTGTLDGAAVLDVSVRESDGTILHWLAINGERTWEVGTAVSASIHWPRRFDHMQQHSGQHILSRAFIQVANAHTISFHLSAESVTIDLDTESLNPAQIRTVEELANQIVWENRPIHIREVTLAEAKQLNLRKLPPTLQDKLRLIDIEDFDLTACGGTHVTRTGAVGLIKITRLEKIRGQVRVVFCCGGRALRDYDSKNETLMEMGTLLTTGHTEFPQTIQRLQDELKEANRTIKKQADTLLTLEAERLLAAGQQLGKLTVVLEVTTEKNPGQLRVLANLITQHPGVVALLGLAGEKSFLLFSRAADSPGDMNALLQETLQSIGGRGGGTAVTAQGGGAPISPEQLHTVFKTIIKKL